MFTNVVYEFVNHLAQQRNLILIQIFQLNGLRNNNKYFQHCRFSSKREADMKINKHRFIIKLSSIVFTVEVTNKAESAVSNTTVKMNSLCNYF